MATTERDERTGRWYITMGTPGFNLPANNGRGYATKAAAERAVARCSSRGPRPRLDDMCPCGHTAATHDPRCHQPGCACQAFGSVGPGRPRLIFDRDMMGMQILRRVEG